MSERSDHELVQASRRGDLEAFEQLMRRHSTRIFTVASRVLVDRRDAEEATQDTFVQAWRSLHRFRGDAQITTWLHRICVNRCLRERRRRAVVVAPLGDGDDHRDPSPGPADTVASWEELATVGVALDRIPELQREAVVLRDIAGLSYEEVADMLDISLTAARSRIHRGRAQLLRALPATADGGDLVAAGETNGA